MRAHTSRRALRARSVALVLTATLLVPVIPTQASGWPVVDALLNKTQFKAQIEAVMQYAKQIQGMAKDAAHYKATYDKYQQELIKLQRMVTGLSMLGERDPAKRDRLWNIERCGGRGFSLTSTLRNVLTDSKGDIYRQQKDICAWIQVTENDRYNLTIDMISEVRKETENAILKAAARRDTDNRNGTVSVSDNDLLTLNTQLTAVHKNYEANMKAYESQLSALKSAQVSLADNALRGERGPLGTLVKTTALQGALKIGK